MAKEITSFKKMPWKNGGGETTEIYCRENDKRHSRFDIRFSVAKVESNGPFSLFENVDRTLVLLSGNGVELQFSNKKILLNQKCSPINFSGEEKIESTLLNGPCLDFNIMIDRHYGRVNVIVNPDVNTVLKNNSFLFFYYNNEGIDQFEFYSMKKNENLNFISSKMTARFQCLIEVNTF